MGFFDSAKDSLKGAVGDMAESSVDSVRDAVAEVLQQQLEDLLGKAVVKMVASINDELQEFAALHLATKADITRLEASISAALASATTPARVGAVEVAATRSVHRPKAMATVGPAVSTTPRRAARTRPA